MTARLPNGTKTQQALDKALLGERHVAAVEGQIAEIVQQARDLGLVVQLTIELEAGLVVLGSQRIIALETGHFTKIVQRVCLRTAIL